MEAFQQDPDRSSPPSSSWHGLYAPLFSWRNGSENDLSAAVFIPFDKKEEEGKEEKKYIYKGEEEDGSVLCIWLFFVSNIIFFFFFSATYFSLSRSLHRPIARLHASKHMAITCFGSTRHQQRSIKQPIPPFVQRRKRGGGVVQTRKHQQQKTLHTLLSKLPSKVSPPNRRTQRSRRDKFF